MVAKPDNIGCLLQKIDGNNESEVISLNIEDHSLLCDEAGSPIYSFEFIKILKDMFRKLMVPGQQRYPCQRVFVTIIENGPFDNDIHYAKVR
jgi:hypothetical protein